MKLTIAIITIGALVPLALLWMLDLHIARKEQRKRKNVQAALDRYFENKRNNMRAMR